MLITSKNLTPKFWSSLLITLEHANKQIRLDLQQYWLEHLLLYSYLRTYGFSGKECPVRATGGEKKWVVLSVQKRIGLNHLWPGLLSLRKRPQAQPILSVTGESDKHVGARESRSPGLSQHIVLQFKGLSILLFYHAL